MDTKQFNVRLPRSTQNQIAKLEAKTGMTQTQLMILAIDNLYYKYDAHIEPEPEPSLYADMDHQPDEV